MLIDAYKEMENLILNDTEFLHHPTKDSSKGFIQAYFQNRSKESLFDFNIPGKETVKYSRSVHTVSAFYLGLYLRDLVEAAVLQMIKSNCHLENNKFEYPWFLSCLFHDVFTEYENEMKKLGMSSLDSMTRKLGISHTIYKPNLPEGLLVAAVPFSYDDETVSQYYKYRYKDGKIDHGIVSGIYAYDALVKNYLKERELHKGENQFHTEGPVCTLQWEPPQLWVFGFVSDAIIAHNIWHMPEKKGLPSKLSTDHIDHMRLNISNSPLAYFLSLIDTIEPTKFFCNIRASVVLENIDIVMDDDGIIISQASNGIFDFEQWYEVKMKNMPDWLEGCIPAYKSKTDEIIITIKA